MTAKASGLSFLGLCIALAGCASFEDELPESCVVVMDELNAGGVLVEIQTRFVRVAQKTLDEPGAELFPGKAAGYRYDLAEFDAVPAGELERRLVARRDLVENKVCRVTTRSGEEAVFKDVTEYIYPTDYDVQMSSYAPSGSNDWVRTGEYGFASVEPQPFTMREVGSILQVTPTLTDDGQVMDLEMNVQIVTPPEWMDYGMQLPSAIGGSYALPMKQPFFPVASSDMKLSVTPGETVIASSGVIQGKSDETEFVFVRTRKLALDGRPAKAK